MRGDLVQDVACASSVEGSALETAEGASRVARALPAAARAAHALLRDTEHRVATSLGEGGSSVARGTRRSTTGNS